MTKKDQVIQERLPVHVAIIMDGNGRWAHSRNRPRVFGHQNGVKAVREVTEGAAELGIKYLTLYAFSRENWKRPVSEVNTLMSLFVRTVDKELDELTKNNIRLKAIGDTSKLPKATFQALNRAIEQTENNTRMTLILALNYSSRWEITEAAKALCHRVKSEELEIDDLSENDIEGQLETAEYPDPDLMIRTSGEYRISNFLLWQLSYAELYFTDTLWPDFTKEDLYDALIDYQDRERRFGMTTDQLTKP
jgi:undecaprenyl diphosphate synthase